MKRVFWAIQALAAGAAVSLLVACIPVVYDKKSEMTIGELELLPEDVALQFLQSRYAYAERSFDALTTTVPAKGTTDCKLGRDAIRTSKPIKTG